jgi:hypothetical protein
VNCTPKEAVCVLVICLVGEGLMKTFQSSLPAAVRKECCCTGKGDSASESTWQVATRHAQLMLGQPKLQIAMFIKQSLHQSDHSSFQTAKLVFKGPNPTCSTLRQQAQRKQASQALNPLPVPHMWQRGLV